MLLSWVSDHYRRTDEMSYKAHAALYKAYKGSKVHLLRHRSVDSRAL